MKQFFQKSVHILPITACVMILCWNGSVVDSTTKDKRPDVNFYGTITDGSGTYQAEDILINDLYEKINFYRVIKPTDTSAEKESVDQPKSAIKDIDPKQSKTPFDLQEIKTIEAKYPDQPTKHETKINSSNYVEIIVTTIDDAQHNFLVESSRKISYREVNKNLENDKKLLNNPSVTTMLALKSLEIKGHKLGEDAKERKYQADNDKDKKDITSNKVKIANDTENILDEMEEKVKNLPKDDSSQYDKFKKSMISLLRSLRDQLQKMLNMIKN